LSLRQTSLPLSPHPRTPPAPLPALPLTRTAPGCPASSHPAMKKLLRLLYFFIPGFFSHLKSRITARPCPPGINHRSREVKEGKTAEFSAHPFGAEATPLLLLLLLLFLPIPEVVVLLGFSVRASPNKSRLLCELGAWEKPRPREKQTSPAPGLRINTGVLLVTEAELNQSC